ncbi:outer membrane beta-barrel protein [Neorhodopirellula pilleata]|uniref:Porin n=1 Tax=Neorhodopirellula pilleata TaxID=2714738 RepID=A0A5C6AVV4_9BACT|nr:outer membrane beta-barrel protein [Neorhodopirellula pilleata]TWU03196.1 hypothetical protein Pla100_01140 [Neorhodopirellula pilleata]
MFLIKRLVLWLVLFAIGSVAAQAQQTVPPSWLVKQSEESPNQFEMIDDDDTASTVPAWQGLSADTPVAQPTPSPASAPLPIPLATPPIQGSQDISQMSDSFEMHSGDVCDLRPIRSSRHVRSDDLFGWQASPWRMGGWLQQGFTINPEDPANGSNAPVLFNDAANDYQLNQLYFYLGREATINGQTWDWGGRVDVNYGTDSRYVTVPGLERHEDRSRRWNSEDSDYGIALPQAYLDLATPIGPYGSVIRAGHFYALGGYETFAAPENFFYSHAYTFLYGNAFTQSGVMWSGKLSPTLAGAVSATTGWDSFYSDGDDWGVRAGLMKELGGGQTTIALTGHYGNDFTGFTDASGSINGDRVWASLVLKHYLRPSTYYVMQADYGYQEGSTLELNTATNTVEFGDGNWWGINQYLVQQLSEKWSAGLRVEWFRDDSGTRLGVPVEYSTGGTVFNGEDYFAITGGVHYQPHSNVLLRNEIRWDTSNVESNPAVPGGVAGIKPFNDRSDDNQLLIALDAIIQF